ncbi:hypothetical protein O6H91_08G033200 [Diphasiastrum complanatum]|uniref:Uncharacterized protein n=2 Tax=Diphasiastrum complanatum TaxID=34168 RepID=A0ACC2CWK6_DIPCM|nr:hypothetical protein O6H91_08G032100 [Diphasiastrum complanatum]KAJ7546279.1 hypothetical protein O6H91_08G033200 [Diphasiastrum complanatum]
MMMERPWVFLLWMLVVVEVGSQKLDRLFVNAARNSNLAKSDGHYAGQGVKSTGSLLGENGVRTDGPGTSSSVLVALLESPYTEWMELVERAALLEPLEKVVGKTNITIFAPRNAFLDQHLDPDLKRFLLEPGNVKELRRVLQYHIVPQRIRAIDWSNITLRALSTDGVYLHSRDRNLRVELSTIAAPDSIVSHDGVVHGIDGLMIPKSVQYTFAQKKRGGIPNAVLPQSAPELDPAISQLPEVKRELLDFLFVAPDASALPSAPAPDLAPAPAPGPSAAHHHIYGDVEVADFVSALANYGGYSEIAELLVNLTTFAWDMGKLMNEGRKFTLLAPNDHAIDHITAEQLNAPGGIDALLMYHVLSEYQTEESLYTTVKRVGKVTYSTLHVPHKITAREEDGTVQFNEGEHAAVIFDQDIFTDGSISIQGISKVLQFPAAHVEALPSAP